MTTTLLQLQTLLEKHGLLVKTLNLTSHAEDLVISSCDCDSRVVEPGSIFVCKGVHFNPSYLSSALQKGAVAYLCAEELASSLAKLAPTTPALICNNIRTAMALVAREAYAHPNKDLTVIGITGTKGKTTVSYMLRTILDGEDPYSTTAVLGSIETYDGIIHENSSNTTPEAPDLWRHLAHARTSGLKHMVMEVSSQGLKYDRVLGLEFDIACFLNIGNDHISPIEHPNFEDYVTSKLKIFDHAHTAVVNLDMDYADRVLTSAKRCEKLITFSARDTSADVWASDVRGSMGIVSFIAHTPSWEGPIRMAMPGLFNVENALAAIAMCEALGVDAQQIMERFFLVRVPGRMELLLTPDRRVIGLVDYAHNELAFKRLFPSLKEEFPNFTLISLFGAVGSKALERRIELPKVAAEFSDYLIYTEDDPGSERVEDICAQMVQATPAGVPCEVILKRDEAVMRAVELAYKQQGPVLVCLLAKGPDTTQHIGNEFVPCLSDADLFQEAVRRFSTNTLGTSSS